MELTSTTLLTVAMGANHSSYVAITIWLKVTNVTLKQKVPGPGYVSQPVHWSEVEEEMLEGIF